MLNVSQFMIMLIMIFKFENKILSNYLLIALGRSLEMTMSFFWYNFSNSFAS